MNEEEIKAQKNQGGQPAGGDSAEGGAPAEGLKGRAKLRGRYKEAYPEENWDEMDDDALADRAMSRYDELDGKLKKHDEREKLMNDAFNRDPRSAAFLMGIVNGKSLEDNLYETLGDDVVEMFSSPEKLEEVKKRHAEKLQQIAKAKEMEDAWDKNMPETIARIEQEKQTAGLTDEQVAEALNELERVVDEYGMGNVSTETLKMFLRGKNYDKDMESAKREGEIQGKNNEFEERLRQRVGGDNGLPMLGGQSSNNAQGRGFRQDKSGRENVGSGIWANSGFKRNEYK